MSQANLSQSLPTNFSIPGGESILEHQMDNLMNAMDHMHVVEVSSLIETFCFLLYLFSLSWNPFL